MQIGVRRSWITVFCVAAMLITACQPPSNMGSRHPQVGGRMGNLHLEPLTGDSQPVELEELRGKVVLLNFWGTWCGPCMSEFPHLAALHEKYKASSDLVVLPVSCEPGGTDDIESLRTDTQAFLDKMKATLPTYADPDMSARQLVAKYVGFTGYPKTLLLDREGIVRGIWDGYMPGDEEQVQDLVWRVIQAKDNK